MGLANRSRTEGLCAVKLFSTKHWFYRVPIMCFRHGFLLPLMNSFKTNALFSLYRLCFPRAFPILRVVIYCCWKIITFFFIFLWNCKKIPFSLEIKVQSLKMMLFLSLSLSLSFYPPVGASRVGASEADGVGETAEGTVDGRETARVRAAVHYQVSNLRLQMWTRVIGMWSITRLLLNNNCHSVT